MRTRRKASISTNIINISGLRSNIPKGGTNLRMGFRNGETILSKALRMGLNGFRKYERIESTNTTRIKRFANVLMILAIILNIP
jgi:hypothetical protein